MKNDALTKLDMLPDMAKICESAKFFEDALTARSLSFKI